MASCPHSPDDAGYATPAALVLSLAVALMASALVSRGVLLLRMTRADLDKVQVEYAMSGAQLEATASVVRSGVSGPFHWTASTDQGAVEVVAEREADKLSLEAAAGLDPAIFERFGVHDTEGLRTRLAEAAQSNGFVDVETLDAAVLWRTCAARLASPYGVKTDYAYTPAVEPANVGKPALWRVGEEWRIKVTTATGWRDDRIVRFTGDARHPAAVVMRKVSRGDGEGGRCTELLQVVAG